MQKEYFTMELLQKPFIENGRPAPELGLFMPRSHRHSALDDYEGDPSPYAVPPLRERQGLFWEFMEPLLGARAYRPGGFAAWRLPVEPRVEDGVDWRIEAVRRRETAIAKANRPPTPLQAIGAELVDVVTTAVAKVAKASKLTEARQWVAEKLKDAPMKAVKLQKLAGKAGIAERTLRRALKVMKVQHTRNSDKTWSMSLVQAGQPE